MFEISIQKIEIVVNGIHKKKKAKNVLTANLVYPMTNFKSTETTFSFKIDDFKSTNLPEIPSSHKVLYKGHAEGTVYLEFNITAEIPKSKIQDIIIAAVAAGIISTTSLLTLTAFGATLLVGAGKSIAESIFELGLTKEVIKSIGKVQFAFTDTLEEGEHKIPFLVPETIKVKEKSQGIGKIKKLDKGFKNGYITLLVKKTSNQIVA